MDWILDVADGLVLDKVYASLIPTYAFLPSSSPLAAWPALVSSLPHPPLPANSTMAAQALVSAWPRDYIPRQLLSLGLITLIGIHALYFLFAGISYYTVFDHNMMRHPRFQDNQVAREIAASLHSFPGMTLLTLPWFLGEVRGHSRIYVDVADYGWPYLIFSVIFFLVFTDYSIYLIHRGLHHPIIYRHVHKPHHRWLIPTPFASHAFHPLDGYLQSVPYHLFAFIFPLQRYAYLGLFVAVNVWSIFIHDSDMITGGVLENYINGPAHHTLHHLYFNCNYGQYFTWADKAGGSYKHPHASFHPLLEVPEKQKVE